MVFRIRRFYYIALQNHLLEHGSSGRRYKTGNPDSLNNTKVFLSHSNKCLKIKVFELSIVTPLGGTFNLLCQGNKADVK